MALAARRKAKAQEVEGKQEAAQAGAINAQANGKAKESKAKADEASKAVFEQQQRDHKDDDVSTITASVTRVDCTVCCWSLCSLLFELECVDRIMTAVSLR